MTEDWNLEAPWNLGVSGDQVLPLINLDAPVIRVEAGPGTGKTFGLKKRVLRLTHPKGARTPGEQVLVVAFNRVIASDLATSIRSQLDAAELETDVRVSTIHGLCQQLLADDDRRMLLPHEVEAMLYDLRMQHHAFVGVTFDDLSQRLRDHEAGHKIDHALEQAADGWLATHAAKLVGDLPRELLGRIRGGDFDDLKFTHVVVDEFQDLTHTEQALVADLVSGDGTLLALGDPRQSIYAFRGNDRMGLDRLEELTGREVEDLPMDLCQRCPGSIVAAANALTALEGVAMTSTSNIQPNLHLVHWQSPQAEAHGMARAIIDNWESHPEDLHLVMVSRRRLGFMLREEINALRDDVAVDLTFSESILEEWLVREAFLFFCLLADPDPATWRAWLAYRANETQSKAPDRNADAYLRFLESCADQRITVDDLRRLAAEPRAQNRGSGGVHIWDRSARLLALLDGRDWAGLDAVELVKAVFDPLFWQVPAGAEPTVLHDFELIRDRSLDKLFAITNDQPEISRPVALAQVAAELRYRIATREPFDEGSGARIQVTTLWGAKGLTAQHVYLIGVCDEAIPGRRSDSYPGPEAAFLDEQRRLFFVSLTRTKETLVISQLKRVQRAVGLRMRLRINPMGWHQADLSMSRYLETVQEHFPPSIAGQDWQGPLGI